MKRIVTIAALAVLVLSGTALNAQNKFKGIVKYSITSTGSVAVEIPAERSTSELKVYEDKVMQGTSLQEGRTTFQFIDLSQLLGYLGSQGVELTSYTGDGKIFLRHAYTQLEIDSLTIPCTEGFYIEYIADQTKSVAGYNAKLARIHIFGENGEDSPVDMWYTDEIGPEVNFLANGVKGVPLEYTQELGDGKAITMTATEVVKGKVKDVDFLMPAGYKEMTVEDWQAFQEELEEEMEFLE